MHAAVASPVFPRVDTTVHTPAMSDDALKGLLRGPILQSIISEEVERHVRERERLSDAQSSSAVGKKKVRKPRNAEEEVSRPTYKLQKFANYDLNSRLSDGKCSHCWE